MRWLLIAGIGALYVRHVGKTAALNLAKEFQKGIIPPSVATAPGPPVVAMPMPTPAAVAAAVPSAAHIPNHTWTLPARLAGVNWKARTAQSNVQLQQWIGKQMVTSVPEALKYGNQGIKAMGETAIMRRGTVVYTSAGVKLFRLENADGSMALLVSPSGVFMPETL